MKRACILAALIVATLTTAASAKPSAASGKARPN